MHDGQMRRTRRWPTTASTDEAMRKLSMPMSKKRCRAETASVACKEEITKCPVRDVYKRQPMERPPSNQYVPLPNVMELLLAIETALVKTYVPDPSAIVAPPVKPPEIESVE